MFPMKTLFTLLRVVAFILFFVLMFFFLTSLRIELKEKEVTRTAIELAEAVTQRNFIAGKAVFKKEELDRFNGQETEPYVRHCSIGVRITVENLVTKEKWQFGYKPGTAEIVATDTVIYPAGIHVPDPQRNADFYDTAQAATLTVAAYDTLLTRMSCIAEKAYRNKEPESMVVVAKDIVHYAGATRPFVLFVLSLHRKNGDSGSEFVCAFAVDRSGTRDLPGCRYLPGVPLHDFYWAKSNDKAHVLKALPIKRGAALPAVTSTCSDDILAAVASAADEVGEVALCLEELPEKK